MSSRLCKNCGSTLGLDCGQAEPDFDYFYCSRGCFAEHKQILCNVDKTTEWLAASILIFSTIFIVTLGPSIVLWLSNQ